MKNDIQHPFEVLGWLFMIMAVLLLLTSAQASDLGDKAMLWATFPTGICWFVIGSAFVTLDRVFNTK